jgi:4-hydroxy-tetrahydrodipicolinate reductase
MKLIINGINGRMGRMVIETSADEADLAVVCGFDTADSPLGSAVFRGEEVPVFKDYGKFGGSADVIIDFSHYSAVPALIDFAVDRGLPVVVATTALDESALARVREAAKSVAVFRSANMSLGVNVISKMSQLAVPALENGYDIEIIEKHHNKKVDSPSGTALMLADAINEKCAIKKDYVYGRHGRDDSVKATDLGIHAVRGGTIPGQHSVLFAGPDETIEITHTVYSRRVFAAGALKAARFISCKAPGLYNMDDIIG